MAYYSRKLFPLEERFATVPSHQTGYIGAQTVLSWKAISDSDRSWVAGMTQYITWSLFSNHTRFTVQHQAGHLKNANALSHGLVASETAQMREEGGTNIHFFACFLGVFCHASYSISFSLLVAHPSFFVSFFICRWYFGS